MAMEAQGTGAPQGREAAGAAQARAARRKKPEPPNPPPPKPTPPTKQSVDSMVDDILKNKQSPDEGPDARAGAQAGCSGSRSRRRPRSTCRRSLPRARSRACATRSGRVGTRRVVPVTRTMIITLTVEMNQDGTPVKAEVCATGRVTTATLVFALPPTPPIAPSWIRAASPGRCHRKNAPAGEHYVQFRPPRLRTAPLRVIETPSMIEEVRHDASPTDDHAGRCSSRHGRRCRLPRAPSSPST